MTRWRGSRTDIEMREQDSAAVKFACVCLAIPVVIVGVLVAVCKLTGVL